MKLWLLIDCIQFLYDFINVNKSQYKHINVVSCWVSNFLKWFDEKWKCNLIMSRLVIKPSWTAIENNPFVLLWRAYMYMNTGGRSWLMCKVLLPMYLHVGEMKLIWPCTTVVHIDTVSLRQSIQGYLTNIIWNGLVPYYSCGSKYLYWYVERLNKSYQNKRLIQLRFFIYLVSHLILDNLQYFPIFYKHKKMITFEC